LEYILTKIGRSSCGTLARFFLHTRSALTKKKTWAERNATISLAGLQEKEAEKEKKKKKAA